MDSEDKELLKGHRDRLRTKYLNAGLEALLDYERLELLLTYAISRRDVKPVSKRLLARFKSLSGVLDADVKDLCQVEGLAESSALLLKLVKDLCGEYLSERMEGRDILNSAQAVRDFLKLKISGLNYEVFMVIYLDIKNQLICSEIINKGTVDQATVYPREIVKRALEVHASGVILAHNHPSGISKPSSDDVLLTNAIRDAVSTMGIRLLDHMVVGKDRSFSFVEGGLL